MAAIDDLRSADSLQFSNVSYHLSVPLLGDSDSTTGAFCAQKTPGQLQFTITSTQLGFNLDGGVVASLIWNGTLSGGNVVWTSAG